MRDITAGTWRSERRAREDRRQRTEDRGQKTEDGRQRTEDRGRKTEDGRQRTEDRGQKTEPPQTTAVALSSVFCSSGLLATASLRAAERPLPLLRRRRVLSLG